MAKITVDFEKCKGCGLCTTACPKKIVEIQKEKRNRNVRDYVSRLCYYCRKIKT